MELILLRFKFEESNNNNWLRLVVKFFFFFQKKKTRVSAVKRAWTTRRHCFGTEVRRERPEWVVGSSVAFCRRGVRLKASAFTGCWRVRKTICRPFSTAFTARYCPVAGGRRVVVSEKAVSAESSLRRSRLSRHAISPTPPNQRPGETRVYRFKKLSRPFRPVSGPDYRITALVHDQGNGAKRMETIWYGLRVESDARGSTLLERERLSILGTHG